jgi:high affinity Mn2+ porin
MKTPRHDISPFLCQLTNVPRPSSPLGTAVGVPMRADAMSRCAVRWSLLAMVLACMSATPALAQTIEFGAAGEGGSGKSIGGNIPAAPPTDEEKPPAEPWYTIHAQATVILQGYAPFRSPYTGTNSFVSAYELRTTATSTLFFAAKLPWEGGLLIINPEESGGRGVSDVFGLGGPPNGEAVRVGNPQPTPYFARFLLQQTISLGGEWEKLANIANQIPEPRYKNNVVIKIGKMPAIDDFDDNTYSHDPRLQFLNWSFMYNPTWDYGANTRGYTYGFDIEANIADWSARYGAWQVPRVANQEEFDSRILKAWSMAWEVEQRWTILNDLPGTARLLGWLNSAHMGSYRDSLQLSPVNPDITATERYRLRGGLGLSWEQELVKNELAVFGRLGYADGHAETWAFTEVERTISIGMLLKGKAWDRPKDEIGLAVAFNGLGPQHRDYLAAGGLGFELGDGKLNYGPETIVETYYSVRVRKGIYVTLDLQGIANPGYNRDRGPVGLIALRTHIEF